MTEIGESAAVIAEEQLQEDHWVKVELYLWQWITGRRWPLAYICFSK